MRSSQLHRNTPLENISMAFTPQGYIGDQLSPVVMVEKESNLYYVYSKDFMGLPETQRADGAESNRANFNISTSSYQLEEHALHDDITDRQRENADTAIKLDIDLTEYLTGVIKTRREVDLASLVQTKANWANQTSLTSTLAWSANTTTSNPITQVDSASTVILVNSGRKPNVMAMNDQTFNAAKEHVSIVDRVKYTSQTSVTRQILANLFNVGEVLVAEAMYNSNDEGLADAQTRVWNDTVFIGYVERAPGLKKVSALYTFWKNNTGKPTMVKRWRENKLNADRIEASAMFQNQAPATDCGYLILDTVQ